LDAKKKDIVAGLKGASRQTRKSLLGKVVLLGKYDGKSGYEKGKYKVRPWVGGPKHSARGL